MLVQQAERDNDRIQVGDYPDRIKIQAQQLINTIKSSRSAIARHRDILKIQLETLTSDMRTSAGNLARLVAMD